MTKIVPGSQIPNAHVDPTADYAQQRSIDTLRVVGASTEDVFQLLERADDIGTPDRQVTLDELTRLDKSPVLTPQERLLMGKVFDAMKVAPATVTMQLPVLPAFIDSDFYTVHRGQDAPIAKSVTMGAIPTRDYSVYPAINGVDVQKLVARVQQVQDHDGNNTTLSSFDIQMVMQGPLRSELTKKELEALRILHDDMVSSWGANEGELPTALRGKYLAEKALLGHTAHEPITYEDLTDLSEDLRDEIAGAINRWVLTQQQNPAPLTLSVVTEPAIHSEQSVGQLGPVGVSYLVDKQDLSARGMIQIVVPEGYTAVLMDDNGYERSLSAGTHNVAASGAPGQMQVWKGKTQVASGMLIASDEARVQRRDASVQTGMGDITRADGSPIVAGTGPAVSELVPAGTYEITGMRLRVYSGGQVALFDADGNEHFAKKKDFTVDSFSFEGTNIFLERYYAGFLVIKDGTSHHMSYFNRV